MDDDDSIRLLLFKKLQNLGFEIIGANSLKSAKKHLEKNSFDAIILDQYLDDGTGYELISDILDSSPFSKIIFLTANESIDFASKALTNGATGFLVKSSPLDENINKFINFLQPKKISFKSEYLENTGIVGQSSALLNVINKINKIRYTDTTTLIYGESGVGKELFAQSIHKLSDRSSAPFIAINCAAISEHLLEAELFGSKKGAFTDARTDRKGYFETCSNGTLLLDEIGEMSPSMQAKLLRVLQEKEITPVGSCHPVKVNTRVIAATNRVLMDEVKKGNFREDLYYRLAIINIDIPPLRERIEDVPLLFEYFLKKFNKKFGKSIRNPSNEVYAKIKAYPWPGNVRELYNAIERAVLLSNDNQIYIEDLLPPKIVNEESSYTQDSGMVLDYKQAKNNFEKVYIEKLLRYTNNSITDAARVSKQYRTNIYRLIEKHNIRPKK